ncbi:MAG: VWA domain-containing protein [Candidatus Aminicenantales bacterium]
MKIIGRTALKSKGVLLLGLALVAASALPAGQEAGKVIASPVEVRVRVSDGGRFVDSLGIKDFEILENGLPQSVDALYVVHGQKIDRREESHPVEPSLARSYYLLFQAVDWDPRLAETIEYLFSSVLLPGDSMTLVTPMKPYNLQKDALATKSKAALSKNMQEILRKDIQRGGGEYRDIIKTLRRVSNTLDGNQRTIEDDMESDTSSSDFGLEQQLDLYRNAIKRMESIRLVDESKLVAFANSIKSRPGQKTVYFFYEREFRPEMSPLTMQLLLSEYQNNPTIQGNLMDLFQVYKREATFNADRVKKAFADADLSLNFIFMDKKSQHIFGGSMHEQSEDIFPGFRDLAQSTGGVCEVSQNPAASFKHAAAVSESYYLLYYTPADRPADGSFRPIEVKVKAKDPAGKDYAVNSRLGYYAR